MFYIIAMTALVFDIIVERENLDCTTKINGER